MAGKSNINLHSAKDAKDDEFYTQLIDIQAELKHYSDTFEDKIVFCNCDDPFESNFVKYFLMNFNRLKLRKLIATGYKTSFIGGVEFGEANKPYVLSVTDTSKYLIGTQKDLDVSGIKNLLDAEGQNVMRPLFGNAALDDEGNQIQESVKMHLFDDNGQPILDKKGKHKIKKVMEPLYYEAGDFRSDMSLALLKEADIVVTNPPFSLFREYLDVLMRYNKLFLIIGNMNAITYKEVYPLIGSNKMWLGVSRQGTGSMWFRVPKETKGKTGQKFENGQCYQTIGSSAWFTNLDHYKRHISLPLDFGYKYEGHEDMYPKYDNYDAINIKKVEQIPYDYKGVMGVPITFLGKYCPEQFKIVAFRKGNDDKDLVYTENDKKNQPYFRILIQRV